LLVGWWAPYVVDVEGLADADGDEGLAAEVLHREGHAARRDVPDRPERLEDPHRLSLRAPAVADAAATAFSRVSFRWSRGGRAGGEGFRVGFGKGEGRAAAGGGRGFPSRSVWMGRKGGSA
jgi:hypothetical protein